VFRLYRPPDIHAFVYKGDIDLCATAHGRFPLPGPYLKPGPPAWMDHRTMDTMGTVTYFRMRSWDFYSAGRRAWGASASLAPARAAPETNRPPAGHLHLSLFYSTVTLLARLRGLSTAQPRSTAT
jgi:hypothetical protein